MGGLRRPFHETAFAQKTTFDGVRRDKNICWLRMKMVLRRAQKAETFLGNLEVTGAAFHGCLVMIIVRLAVILLWTVIVLLPGGCAHICRILILRSPIMGRLTSSMLGMSSILLMLKVTASPASEPA